MRARVGVAFTDDEGLADLLLCAFAEAVNSSGTIMPEKSVQESHETKEWNNAYFMRFLYEMYPPPRQPPPWGKPTPQPLNKLGLLFEPQTHEEMIFLFSKMHEKIGFPYVTQIQTAYPDVLALDNNRTVKNFASQFHHDPKGCDFIVCWENDLEIVPEDWPEIIQLKDYL